MLRSTSETDDIRSETIEKAATSIRAIFEACGYTEKIAEQQAGYLWGRVISDRLGKNAADMTCVREIRAGQLIVKVEKAAWRHRLTLEVPEVIREINRRLGSEAVTSIRLV